MTSLAEHDKELGRWRSETWPFMVVYPEGKPDRVRVMDERTGDVVSVHRGEVPRTPFANVNHAINVSREYFSSLEDPGDPFEPGECWIIATERHTGLALVSDDGKLVYQNGVRIAPETLDITSAVKIYPQEGN